MCETKTIKTADEYIALQEPPYQEKLEEMRSIIKTAIPEVKELVNQQSISFKNNYMLVRIGIKKNNCSFNTMSTSIIARFKPRLQDYKCCGNTILFSLENPLPRELIRDIVLVREKQNYLKEELKQNR